MCGTRGIFYHMINPTKTTPESHNNFIGYLGETEASQILKKMGHTVIRRNYRNRFGEIDIISLDENKTLCFCEVKTIIIKLEKKDNDAYHPENNLSKRKIGNMLRVIELYLRDFPIEDPYWEAHAVTVKFDPELALISSNFIKNINIEIS